MAIASDLVTAEEYLRREAEAKEKNEYCRGKIFPMAGASENHRSITPLLSFAVQKRLSEGQCRYFDQDTKIQIAALDTYYYADGGVACPPNVVNRAAGAINNPIVIFEVLSPSSEVVDRTTKFHDYATLSSLREYVLIASETPLVEVFRREGPDEWRLSIYTGVERTAQLDTLDMGLPLAEFYADVIFSYPSSR